MAPAGKSATVFLNVDLDLRARRGLKELSRHLGPAMFPLHGTDTFLTAELSKQYDSLEATLLAIFAAIDALPPRARRLLNDCESREINIGIQAGTTPHAAVFGISSKAVALSAKSDCKIVITVYAPADDKPGA